MSEYLTINFWSVFSINTNTVTIWHCTVYTGHTNNNSEEEQVGEQAQQADGEVGDLQDEGEMGL